VIRHGAGVGIAEHLAADLWAHLNDIYSEGQRAHRAALTVIDLGWRQAAIDRLAGLADPELVDLALWDAEVSS
jgi:hypothetical protein